MVLAVSVLLLAGGVTWGTADTGNITDTDEVSVTILGSDVTALETIQSIDLPLSGIEPELALNKLQTLTESVNETEFFPDKESETIAEETNTTGSFDSLYSEGLSLIEAGDFAGALPLFEEAVALDLSSDAAWTRYGETQNALGEFAKGYAALERALLINNANRDAWYGKAIALAGMGQFSEAVTAFKTSFTLMPDNPDILNDLGVILDTTGRYDEAINAFKGALDLSVTRTEFWNNLGVALFHQGRYYEAVGLFSEAIALDPGFGPALMNKAVALSALGHDEEALDTLESFPEEITYNSQLAYEKARILEKLGRYEESDALIAELEKTIVPPAEDFGADHTSATAYITIMQQDESSEPVD